MGDEMAQRFSMMRDARDFAAEGRRDLRKKARGCSQKG